MLGDKQRIKCGGVDTSHLYTSFTHNYLVFCIVLSLFYAFWCVLLWCKWYSSEWIEKKKKRDQMSQNEELEAMPQHDWGMPHHGPNWQHHTKSRERDVVAWPYCAVAWGA